MRKKLRSFCGKCDDDELAGDDPWPPNRLAALEILLAVPGGGPTDCLRSCWCEEAELDDPKSWVIRAGGRSAVVAVLSVASVGRARAQVAVAGWDGDARAGGTEERD